MRVVVSAILEDAQGRIYIQKRWKPHLPTKFNGQWEIPAGGVEEGEDLLTALKREVAEETGLSIVAVQNYKNSVVEASLTEVSLTVEEDAVDTELNFEDVVTTSVPFCVHHVLKTKEGLLWTGYVYRCLVSDTAIKNQDGESKDGKFVTFEELKELFNTDPFFMLHKGALDLYIQTRERYEFTLYDEYRSEDYLPTE